MLDIFTKDIECMLIKLYYNLVTKTKGEASMEKYKDVELFFNEFYKLFDTDNCFTGSMEHARLIIQLNTNKFVHLNFVYKISRLCRDLGLIKKMESKVYVEKEIGLKYFKKRKHFVYYKDTDIDKDTFELIKKSIIKTLSIDFAFEELVDKKLLTKLRNLEELKNIKIENIISRWEGEKTYNQDFSDVDILYGVSKNNLLSYIDSLKKWGEIKQNTTLPPEMQEEIIHESNQYNRDALIEGFYKNCLKLVNKSFEMDKFIYIEMTQLVLYKSVKFCEITLKDMKISKNKFLAKTENMNLNFNIDDIAVSKSNSTIILRDTNIDIEIKINSNFSNEIEKLYEDYCNLVR